MHLGSTKFFFSDNFFGDCFDNIWSCKEHIGVVLYHKGEICQGWGIYSTSSTWSHYQWYLWYHTWWINISLEDLCISSKWFDTLLNSSTSRVIETNAGDACQHSLIHNLANLFSECFWEGSSKDCEVLGESKCNSAINETMTSYNTITIVLLFLHAEVMTPMGYKFVILFECSVIEEKLYSFPGGKFMIGMLFINSFLTSTELCFFRNLVPSLDKGSWWWEFRLLQSVNTLLKVGEIPQFVG